MALTQHFHEFSEAFFLWNVSQMWFVLSPFFSLCENETFLLFFSPLVCVSNCLAVELFLWTHNVYLFREDLLYLLWQGVMSQMTAVLLVLLWICGFGHVKATSPLGDSKNSQSPLLELMKCPEGFPWQVTCAVDCRGSRTERESRSSWVTWTSRTARPPWINGTHGPISRHIPY